jgi:hypothetical protein
LEQLFGTQWQDGVREAVYGGRKSALNDPIQRISMMPRWWSISHVNPRFLHAALVVTALIFSSQLAMAQFSQQGPKLVGAGAGQASQGYSVALSADGSPS